MKLLIAFCGLIAASILFVPAPAQANWSLSQSVVEREDQIQIVNRLTCVPSKSGSTSVNSLCMTLCQASTCEWNEPTCRDCLGTSSEVLRDIFTRLTATYRTEFNTQNTSADSDDFATTLRSMPMILLGPKSPYDFFNSSQDSEFGRSVEASCGSKDGFVAVALDEDSRPMAAVFAICSSRIVRLLK